MPLCDTVEGGGELGVIALVRKPAEGHEVEVAAEGAGFSGSGAAGGEQDRGVGGAGGEKLLGNNDDFGDTQDNK